MLAKDAFDDQRNLMTDKANKIIFDVGANIGQTTGTYRRLFPDALVYSFEPFEEGFKSLVSSFKDDPRIKPVQAAISNEMGQKEFFVNESSTTNSLLRGANTNLVKNRSSLMVPVTTIDNFCRIQSITSVDILKMDIQGGELLALEGAAQMLSSGAISAVFLEVLFITHYEQQAQFHEIAALMAKFHYVLYDLYDLKYMQNGQIAWADALYLSPAFAKSIFTEII